MALDPNEVVSQGIWEKPDDVEGPLQNIKIPEGIDKTQWGTGFYAQWTIYKDGRRVIQWYQRGTGDGKTDPVKAQTEDKIPKVEAAWKEAEAKEAKPDQVVSVNGVPSQVIGKDAQGRDIWGPVQTANGPATANTPASTVKEGDTRGPQTGKTREVYRNGAWVVEANPVYQAPEAPKPTAVTASTDQPFIVQQMPDGTIKSTPNVNYVGPKPERGTTLTIKGGDGKTYLVPVDAQGNPGQARDSGVPAEGNQPLPAGMPTFRPDPAKPGLGIIEYAEQLTALKSQRNADGSPKLTDAQYLQAITQAHQNVTAEAKRLDLIQSAQQQQQTNAINQRSTDIQASVSRLNSANTATQNALDTSQAMAKAFTPSSYAAAGGPILPAVLAMQDARAQSWGGFNQPPQVTTQGYPALGQLNQMGLTPNPNAVIPAVAQLGNMANANQIGAGGIGSAVAPTSVGTPMAPAQAAAVGGPPAIPMTPERVQGMMANPAFRPMPEATYVPPGGTPPMVPGMPSPVGDTGAPPVPAPINPAAGQPGNDPNAPVGMAPQQQPVLPAVHQMGLIAEMRASGAYPPEVVDEAARSLGWL